MNIGELETVTTYDLPIKVVVLNNCGDGMVKQWQKLFHKGRLSASDKSLHTKDFVKAAQADGFKYAVRLDKKADVPRVIGEFIRFNGAAFLEVMIDPDAGVYPMVGPGQAYDEMITGDHIPSRTQVEIKAPGRLGNVLTELAVPRYQAPILGMVVQGSAGLSAAPFCSNSIEMLSGERTNAMRPSRGGRLMVTP